MSKVLFAMRGLENVYMLQNLETYFFRITIISHIYYAYEEKIKKNKKIM
jgi:Ni,Fe-hydrogenase I cytochrome b subunit